MRVRIIRPHPLSHYLATRALTLTRLLRVHPPFAPARSLARSLARSQVRVDFDKLSFLACEAGGAASGVDASEAVLSHVVLAPELFEM